MHCHGILTACEPSSLPAAFPTFLSVTCQYYFQCARVLGWQERLDYWQNVATFPQWHLPHKCPAPSVRKGWSQPQCPVIGTACMLHDFMVIFMFAINKWWLKPMWKLLYDPFLSGSCNGAFICYNLIRGLERCSVLVFCMVTTRIGGNSSGWAKVQPEHSLFFRSVNTQICGALSRMFTHRAPDSALHSAF